MDFLLYSCLHPLSSLELREPSNGTPRFLGIVGAVLSGKGRRREANDSVTVAVAVSR